jgi:hypothetical protein
VRRPAGPRAQKVSITVDGQVLRQVRKLIRTSGLTLSAHVSQALARDLRLRRLAELIESYEREHGRITGRELAGIRAEWGD